MTLDDMINHLLELRENGTNGNAVVKAFDSEFGECLPITGTVSSAVTVELRTDDISDK